jgi:branched-subunit amino acid transport protein
MTVSDVQVWIAIAGLVVMVFVTRNAFVVVPSRWQPRGAVERALRHAPLAALVALTVPPALGAVLVPDWDWAGVWRDARLPAAIVTLVVSRIARSPFPGLAAGTLVLLGLEAGA